MNYDFEISDCQDVSAAAKEFAEKHIVEMCAEMREWDKTSILCGEGYVRQLAAILRPIAGSIALRVAESYVRAAAFDFVIQQGKKTT